MASEGMGPPEAFELEENEEEMIKPARKLKEEQVNFGENKSREEWRGGATAEGSGHRTGPDPQGVNAGVKIQAVGGGRWRAGRGRCPRHPSGSAEEESGEEEPLAWLESYLESWVQYTVLEASSFVTQYRSFTGRLF